MTKLLPGIFEGVGSQALNSLIVTADRGYGKETFMNVMASLGILSIFVMSVHVLKTHIFVAASFLNPHWG